MCKADVSRKVSFWYRSGNLSSIFFPKSNAWSVPICAQLLKSRVRTYSLGTIFMSRTRSNACWARWFSSKPRVPREARRRSVAFRQKMSNLWELCDTSDSFLFHSERKSLVLCSYHPIWLGVQWESYRWASFILVTYCRAESNYFECKRSLMHEKKDFDESRSRVGNQLEQCKPSRFGWSLKLIEILSVREHEDQNV